MTFKPMQETWQDGVRRSKIKRLNYKDILGTDLTKWAYNHFDAGLKRLQVLKLAARSIREYYEHWESVDSLFLPIPLDKAINNASISISARFAEWSRKQNTKL